MLKLTIEFKDFKELNQFMNTDQVQEKTGDTSIEEEKLKKKVKATKEKIKKVAKKLKEEVDEFEDDNDDSDVTYEVVKAFAKDKIKEGADRKEIKGIVKKLGADSLMDLDQEGLEKLYKKLQKL
jgi:hypothetical protein